jgi:hypothetical protein
MDVMQIFHEIADMHTCPKQVFNRRPLVYERWLESVGCWEIDRYTGHVTPAVAEAEDAELGL